LLSAERQQLAGQRRCSLAGLQDLFQPLRQPRRRIETVAQHAGVADDDRQQIVEVVGDTAGQAAHGFHLLRVTKLLFGVLQRFAGSLSLVDLVHQRGICFHQRAGAFLHACFQLFVGLAQPLDRQLAVGDVQRDAQQVLRFSVGAQDRNLLGVQPAPARLGLHLLFGYVQHPTVAQHFTVFGLKKVGDVFGEQLLVVLAVDVVAG
jgi:hypothetical protein